MSENLCMKRKLSHKKKVCVHSARRTQAYSAYITTYMYITSYMYLAYSAYITTYITSYMYF